MAVYAIGSIWGDVAAGAEGAWSAVTGAFESTPLYGPLKDAVEGPLRDFAKTSYGKLVLRAITTQWYGPIAWTIGPQLAAVVFAFPGLMRGESFEDAWLLEFKWRAEKTAETLGPGVLEVFGAQLKEAMTALGDEFEVGELANRTAEELAARLNIREDVAQFAIDLWNRTGPTPRDAFNVTTGKRSRQSSMVQSFVKAAAAPKVTAVSELMISPLKALATSTRPPRPPLVPRAELATEEPAPEHAPRSFGVDAPSSTTTRSKYKTAGDIMLAGVLVAAGYALYRFYAPKRT